MCLMKHMTVLRCNIASKQKKMVRAIEVVILFSIDSSHPLWDYVKDKGGDVAVAGITAGVPVLYNAIKMYLASKGIQLP